MGLFDCVIDDVIRTFGRPGIVFLPRSGGSIPVRGAFTEVGTEITVGGATVMTSAPSLFLDIRSLAHVPTAQDRFVIDGRKFQVMTFLADGEGGATVELHEL